MKYDLKRAGRNALILGGMSLASLLGGCGDNDPKNEYSFDKVNYRMDTRKGFFDLANQAEAADFDGDGDEDILVLLSDGSIIIYENKIPQKNK